MDTISLTEFTNLRISAMITIIMVFLAVVLIVLRIIKICRVIKREREQKYTEKVLESSARYNQLLALNRKYTFHNLSNYYNSVKWVSSKVKYDKFDFDKYFEKIVELEREDIQKYQSEVIENRLLKKEYDEELSHICDYANEDMVKGMGLNWEKYHQLEVAWVQGLIQNPVTEAWIKCTKEYRSPQGRNFYSEDKYYTFADYEKVLRCIEEFNRKKDSAEGQRRIMTDSLRYDVMKRDGFRCVLCGRSASEDGVKLHVDHIRPVSKGGKTEMSNLRTLCEQCNWGKSDKYDETGVN